MNDTNFEDFDKIEDFEKYFQQNLSTSKTKKIDIALLARPLIEKSAKENLSDAGKGIKIKKTVDTYTELSKMCGVSRTTIVRYVSVLNNGSEDIINDMKSGKISISSAASANIKNIKERIKNKYLSYEDAQIFVRNLGITSGSEYKEWWQKNKPIYLPCSIDEYYKNNF